MASEWGTCWTGQSGHILHGREFSWQRCLGTFKVHIIDASPSLFVQNFKGQWIDPRPHRDPVPLVQNSHHSSRRTSISPHLLWSIPVTHSRGHKDRDEQSQHTLQDLGLLLGIIFCCCFFLKFFFLAALGLSCCMRDLWFSLCQAESSVAVCELLSICGLWKPVLRLCVLTSSQVMCCRWTTWHILRPSHFLKRTSSPKVFPWKAWGS